MQKCPQKIEITCPACHFVMSGMIEKIPQNFSCPHCYAEFSIVAQTSTPNDPNKIFLTDPECLYIKEK